MAPPVAGYSLWFDASQITGVADGATLATWPDLSGNGWNATTTGTGPTFYKTTTAKLINGLPAVWFGNSLFTAAHTVVNGTDGTWTVFAVGFTNGSGTQFALNGDDTFADNFDRVAQFLRINGGNVETIAFDTSTNPYIADAGSPSTTTASLMSAVRTTSTVTARLNGTAGTPTSLVGPAKIAASGVDLGSHNGGANWSGPLGEIIVYPSALNSTDVASVESYLTAKWLTAPGLTVTGQAAVLPRTRGYATAAGSTVSAHGQAPVLPRTGGYGTPSVGFPVVSVTAHGQAPLLPRTRGYGNAAITVSTSIVPSTQTGYAFLARTRGFKAIPTLQVAVAVPPTCEPNNLSSIWQVSETYPAPVLIKGLPYNDSSQTPWQPSSVTRQVWATQLQLLVGGQDVTFFRCVPTTAINWSSQEPFADATASFTLPAVTTFDGLPVAASLPVGETVGIAVTATGNGYWLASAQGVVSDYGDASYLGDPLSLLNQPVSGIAAHPSAPGYALCARDGGVFDFGAVGFHGNALGALTPVVGIAVTATGNGYWLLEESGTVHAFGDAVHYGDAAVSYPTNQATGIARSGGGAGYVIVANNGGVFCLGDATYRGNGVGAYVAPYVGVACHPGTDGYLIVNSLGDVYTFNLGYHGGISFPLNQPVNSVALTSDGAGYWMSAGDGGVFAFGDAQFYGSAPGGGINAGGSLSWLRMGAPVTLNRIDHTGTAHTLWEGVIADWEDTTAPGQIGLQVQCVGSLFQLDWYVAKPVVNLPFLGFNPQSGQPVFGWDVGHAIAQAINSVSNPSAGTALGPGPQPAEVGSPFNGNRCTPVTTGILTVTRGNWDQLASGYIQNMLAQAQSSGGYQWTVGLQRPRTPVIKLKNLTGVDWTVSAGARGVAAQLSFDQSTAANAIYGQGTAPAVPVGSNTGQSTVSSWSNSQYPQLYPGSAPAFPLAAGHTYSPGDGQTGLQPFTDWMRQCGYGLASQDTYAVTNAAAGLFDQYLIEQWQQAAGVTVTGLIDAATWNAAFLAGSNTEALASVWYAPLAQLPQVEPYTYTPSGAIAGKNPAFNPNVPRVERYEQMGQQLTKAQGVLSAQLELEKTQTPGWTGTITLTIDPEEGSRFDIQAGQNLLVKYFHGRDTLFHISQAAVDFEALKVTLTVSSQAQDLLTLSAIYARDAQAHGTARVGRPSLVSLNISSNETVFDAESGAGRIWPTAVTGGQWTVLRVPFSESGSCALVDLSSSPATAFAVGVFSGPVTPNQLAAVFDEFGPLSADPAGNNPWNDYAQVGANGGIGLDGYGMLYGAGGVDGACGYWPSDPNGTQVLTGDYIDSQTWPYASAPNCWPWVWVALWAGTNCTISGRFLMAPLAGS